MSTVITPTEFDQVTSIPLLSKHQNPNITSAQIDEAIKEFRLQFPDNADLANISDTQLKQAAAQFLQNDKVFTPMIAGPAIATPMAAGATISCPVAIGVVVVDCIMLVLSFVGLHPANPEALSRDAVPEAARVIQNDLRGWQVLINDLNNAETVIDKAKAIFKIALAAYRAGMFRGIIARIASSMTDLDWAVTGVVAVAQIAALMGTDGAAFVAQLVFMAASVYFVISDTIKVSKACPSL